MSLLPLMCVYCHYTGTLCLCLASSEDPTADGLTSTSLLEFAMMSHLEAMNSHEQTSPEAAEPDLAPSSLHAAPGSGFASEENEESKILQPPQYFWEDGGELNDSSLDLGPATGKLFLPHSSSHSAGTLGKWKDAGICLFALTQLWLRGPEIKRQLYFLTSVPDVSPVNPEQAQALETKLKLSFYS